MDAIAGALRGILVDVPERFHFQMIRNYSSWRIQEPFQSEIALAKF